MTKFFMVVLSGVMVLACCSGGWGRPYHATPKDALTEFPGYLTSSTAYIPSSVVILQQQPFANGQILLYRWQSPASQQTDTYCLATTYVESALSLRGSGWWSHSSTFLTEPSTSKPVPNFRRTCQLTSDAFVTGSIVRGEASRVTTASGFDGSGHGGAVRVVWSDGQIDTVDLENQSFLFFRSGQWDAPDIELLDENGQILKLEQ